VAGSPSKNEYRGGLTCRHYDGPIIFQLKSIRIWIVQWLSRRPGGCVWNVNELESNSTVYQQLLLAVMRAD
jgi:hypothetical protein